MLVPHSATRLAAPVTLIPSSSPVTVLHCIVIYCIILYYTVLEELEVGGRRPPYLLVNNIIYGQMSLVICTCSHVDGYYWSKGCTILHILISYWLPSDAFTWNCRLRVSSYWLKGCTMPCAPAAASAWSHWPQVLALPPIDSLHWYFHEMFGECKLLEVWRRI